MKSRYQTLLEKIKNLLPKNLKAGVGFYINKNAPAFKNILTLDNSLLVTKVKGHLIIYELPHDITTNKQKIIGSGADAVVREGINVESGKPVAIKLYPYDKKFEDVGTFKQKHIQNELSKWALSQQVNQSVPNFFVKVESDFLAEDKQGRKIHYHVSEKAAETLSQFVERKDISLQELKKVLVKLCEQYYLAYQKGYIYGDIHTKNILIDLSGNPIFCDPSSLIKKTDNKKEDEYIDEKELLAATISSCFILRADKAFDAKAIDVSTTGQKTLWENFKQESVVEFTQVVSNFLQAPKFPKQTVESAIDKLADKYLAMTDQIINNQSIENQHVISKELIIKLRKLHEEICEKIIPSKSKNKLPRYYNLVGKTFDANKDYLKLSIQDTVRIIGSLIDEKDNLINPLIQSYADLHDYLSARMNLIPVEFHPRIESLFVNFHPLSQEGKDQKNSENPQLFFQQNKYASKFHRAPSTIDNKSENVNPKKSK